MTLILPPAELNALTDERCRLERMFDCHKDTPESNAKATEIDQKLARAGLMFDLDTRQIRHIKPQQGRYLVQAYDTGIGWVTVKTAPDSGDMDTLEKAEITFNLYNSDSSSWIGHRIGRLRIVDKINLLPEQMLNSADFPGTSIVKTNQP